MKAYPVYKCRKCGELFTVEGSEIGDEQNMKVTDFYPYMIKQFECQIHDSSCIRIKDSSGHGSEYWLVQAHKCGMLEIGFGDLAGVKFE